MSQAVGFSFQGDVFAGGSLAFSAAGKLLKSLSDGGVDVYAVWALVQLGKGIPISQHQEAIVSRAMQKRSQTRNGYLAKALSIGWGHNDAAYELSKTRGGCAALLTMNAFGAGNSDFVAAQGLQELMRLQGCEVGYLPSVDVIRNVVSFMTPIMRDSGFHSVFETIRLAVVTQLAKRLSVPDFEAVSRSLTTERNAPSEWTNACHQLFLTSKLGESILLQTSSRSVWLAAFAVVVLEMECTLLYGTSVLWGAGGSKGSVTIQITDQVQTPIGFSKTFELRPQPATAFSKKDFEVTYLLEDALRSELLCLPYLSDRCQRNITLAIVRLFTSLVISFSNPRYLSPYGYEDYDFSWPFLHLDEAIMSVCQRLGISLPNIESEISQLIPKPGARQSSLRNQRSFLEEQDQSEICRNCWCEAHQKPEGATRPICLLETIKVLLSGFSATALALLPCAFHTSAVRVRPCVMNGGQPTRLSEFVSSWWTRELSTGEDNRYANVARESLSLYLSHLRALLHVEPDAPESPYSDPLASSAKDTTVAVRALLEEEAFSVSGQYLAIYSGRLSSQGCLREIVTEGRGKAKAGRQRSTKPYTLAAGCLFRPSNASSCRSLSSLCIVDVKSKVFEARFYLVPIRSDLITSTVSEEYPREDSINLSITESLCKLLRSTISSSCGHPKETPLLIPEDSEFELFEAGIDSVLPRSRASCLFLSAHGNRSWQLIAYGSESCQQLSVELRDRVWSRVVILQGDSCLPCAFMLAQRAVQFYEGRDIDRPSKLLERRKASIGVTVICS